MFCKKSRYGLAALIDLSVHSKNAPVSLGTIAKRNEISLQFLEQIFANFRRMKIVRSIKGPQGGYQLAKAPEEITVGAIIEALEGTYHLDAQEVAGDKECQGISDTIQQLVVQEVNRQLDGILAKLTLSELESYYTNHYDIQEMYYI